MAARCDLLKALCCCAEGTCALGSGAGTNTVTAALQNTARFSLLHGRAGLPRSLRSVFAAFVVLFLPPAQFAGVEQRVVALTCSQRTWQSIAISHDGESLIVPYDTKLRVFRTADGALMRVIGQAPLVSHAAFRWDVDGPVPPLWFSKITQVSVAPDGFVFVGDAGNHRVQVLTPQFEFHGVLGCGTEPNGVCANRDVVVLSSGRGFHVLRRSDGATSRQLQREEFYMGQLCFLPDGCHFATPTTHAPSHALFHVCGITVFSLDGEILQQIELMTWAHAIACTAAGELVVTDCYKQRLVVCSARAASLCKPLPRPTHACATSRSLASRCTAVRFTHATPTATGARC